jgi:type I restriction enzyme S subunit
VSWSTAKLVDVAPAKALKRRVVDSSESTWHLNLDQVEAQTGRVLNEIVGPIGDAGNSTHWFDETHVLYSKLRPYLNKVVLPKREGIATSELVPLRPNPELLDRSYLTHYLRSNQFVNWVSAQVAGAKMPRVSMKMFWEHEIPLPPLKEQKRIAAILDKADSLRRKRQQAIQLADEFLRAVFLELFGDPVTNPKGWDMSPATGALKVQGGYAFKSTGFVDSGVPVVKIGNANKVGFTAKSIDFVISENEERLIQYELRPGDLLMSLTGTVGKDDYGNITEVSNEYDRYYLNQRVAKISVIDDQLTKNYLKYFFMHPRIKTEITKNNRGVRQANISNSDIYALNIPIPSADYLSKFDNVTNEINAIIESSKSSLVDSESLFSSCSQKAFNGNLGG